MGLRICKGLLRGCFVRVVVEAFLFILMSWGFGVLLFVLVGWRVGGVGSRVG